LADLVFEVAIQKSLDPPVGRTAISKLMTLLIPAE
jgi:hypothetical protein